MKEPKKLDFNTYKVGLVLVLTVGLIALLPVLSRLVDTSVPRIEVVFFRYFFGFFFLSFISLFWISYEKISIKNIFSETVHSFSLIQIARVVCGMVSLFFLFYSASRMPVLSLKAMTYITPVFASVFSFIFLRDKISKSNQISFLLVITGILIYFRPWELGFTFDIAFYSILLYAVFAGFENLLVKVLSQKYHSLAILFFVNFSATLILSCIVFSQFVFPTLRNLFFLVLLACASIFTQICYLYVVRRLRLTIVMSFSYMGIIFSAIYGELIFGEKVDAYQFLGCVVILISGLTTMIFGMPQQKKSQNNLASVPQSIFQK